MTQPTPLCGGTKKIVLETGCLCGDHEKRGEVELPCPGCKDCKPECEWCAGNKTITDIHGKKVPCKVCSDCQTNDDRCGECGKEKCPDPMGVVPGCTGKCHGHPKQKNTAGLCYCIEDKIGHPEGVVGCVRRPFDRPAPSGTMEEGLEKEVRRIVHKHRRRNLQESCNPELIMLNEQTTDLIAAVQAFCRSELSRQEIELTNKCLGGECHCIGVAKYSMEQREKKLNERWEKKMEERFAATFSPLHTETDEIDTTRGEVLAFIHQELARREKELNERWEGRMARVREAVRLSLDRRDEQYVANIRSGTPITEDVLTSLDQAAALKD